MKLQDKIIEARNRLGITQEELAEIAKVNVRTIQRIEKGTGAPRKYTLKAIASALDIPYQALLSNSPTLSSTADEQSVSISQTVTTTSLLVSSTNGFSQLENDTDFLQTLCLSCFSFIVIPYIHFLLPAYFIRKRQGLNTGHLALGKRLIKIQIYWVICLHLFLSVSLIYNTLQVRYIGNHHYLVDYTWIIFTMYLINTVVISLYILRIKGLNKALHRPYT
ncbi:helix-turn-helix transcriptional regulator [Olivibacter sp. XZL3]|uniref:helix-turn-helix transcriptional regulator n=1 Tax=Olivibacter sp. XZL3 TaxID=1735116 RepID=UPI0010661E48|nr:helix-turn-helix transcriptional regulator [Olivibacter sp. XZL3]